jgi:hypothetical protein
MPPRTGNAGWCLARLMPIGEDKATQIQAKASED